MYTLVTVLLFITCILLVLIVLVQNSKGGGLASNFQSSNQIMGVRKTSDFLEKATWVLAVVLLVLSIGGTAIVAGGQKQASSQSEVQDQIEKAVDPSQLPSFPMAETPNAAPANATAAPDTTK